MALCLSRIKGRIQLSQEAWEEVQDGNYDFSFFDKLWGDGLEEGAGVWGADVGVEYKFKKDNPFLGQPDLLRRGMELFRQGELAQAVLVLEAAVQEHEEDSIAWQTLGQAHADSDDDQQAIACLKRAVSSDPHNLDALLALGVSPYVFRISPHLIRKLVKESACPCPSVSLLDQLGTQVSFTNELDQTRALLHLQHWIESNPEFSSLAPPSLEGRDRANPFALHNQVAYQCRS